jgi:hypothetical protein
MCNINFNSILHISVLFSLCNGQDYRVADIDKQRIDGQEGEEVTVLCRIAKPIVSCHFKIPGEPELIKLSNTYPSKNPNFEYFGAGREQGQCGIKLRMRDSFHGNASCVLDPDDGLADAVGNFEIVIQRIPNVPEIRVINDNQKLTPGDKISAVCFVHDGRPAGNKIINNRFIVL